MEKYKNYLCQKPQNRRHGLRFLHYLYRISYRVENHLPEHESQSQQSKMCNSLFQNSTFHQCHARPSARPGPPTRRHHSWFDRAVIGAAAILLMMASGCNIFDDSKLPVVLIVDLAPSTAGIVEIKELDAELRQYEVTVIPNENWKFAAWSGDIESQDNPLVVTITEQTLIVANFELSGSDFRVDLNFNNEHSETSLAFGTVPGSTDGFDSQWDLESPPPPPDDVLHAWFQAGDRQLLRDFRNPFTTNIEWQLKLQPGAAQAVQLSWSMNLESFSGSLTLWDTRGALSVDMLEESEVKLPADPNADYRITYKIKL